ncbi:MAG: helix-turn-helix transcriptional regulator [Candidatus Thiodiazotropha sp.]|nr:helix-turn-helix domain-containing protein [Candidatus Thiodiazotropha endolucinida]
MLTPFGKMVRRSRDEQNKSLKEMAIQLGVPSSYLSAIEHGQKKVSGKIVDATYRFFGDMGPSREEWQRLAEDSPTHVKIDLTSADDLEREVYLAVGRKFKSMPLRVKQEIRDLLKDDDD